MFAQKQMHILLNKLEEAEKSVAEGIAVEPKLRQKIEELEDETQDLRV